MKHADVQPHIETETTNAAAEDSASGERKRQERLIFDVGMHTGQDTDFYLKKGFKVVGIEANPRLVAQCAARFRSEIDQQRLVVLNVAIARQPATLPFYINLTHSEWSSLDPKLGMREGRFETIEVPAVTLASILNRHGVPYYLKIDIEGYDDIALESLASTRIKPRFVSVESPHLSTLEYLQSLSYSRFKFINQAQVRKMRCPRPAREGMYVRYKFEFGSSGPFGEESVGPWLSAEEVARAISTYWGNPKLDPAVDGWFDLHAGLAETADSAPAAAGVWRRIKARWRKPHPG
ncbi:MAG TPA: FkbM family methyltransferase [Candidatus Binataceae bacterium]|nr:FkbM family methyltransferase [Candidatus Binataceae bacterium]